MELVINGPEVSTVETKVWAGRPRGWFYGVNAGFIDLGALTDWHWHRLGWEARGQHDLGMPKATGWWWSRASPALLP